MDDYRQMSHKRSISAGEMYYVELMSADQFCLTVYVC